MTKTALKASSPTALTEMQFEFIRQFVYQHTGIALSDAKRDLVHGRLRQRLHARQLANFDEYCMLLRAQPELEKIELVNAITTNLTAFYREAHHFDFVRQTLVPEWRKTRKANGLRVWSAGCSTGEEPYSLAMTIVDGLGTKADFSVLATDIDTHVLAAAQRGLYPVERCKNVPTIHSHWLQPTDEKNKGHLRVSPKLLQHLQFKQLNLIEPWPMRGPFDLIFCRNVVIYFDKETQRRLFARFADVLTPHGHLVIGHSETLFSLSERFELVGRTIYRRRA